MSRSKKVPGRNLGLGIKDFTIARKAYEDLYAACPIKSIRFGGWTTSSGHTFDRRNLSAPELYRYATT